MTKDLLQQAIDSLTPQGRTAISNALAQIQNCRNVHYAEFCDLAYLDLERAVTRLAEDEAQLQAWYWRDEITVKGLA